jgi:DUF4097 and DUF4098 domain-containing protein YvlB
MLTLALLGLAALAQGPEFTWSGDLAGKRLTVKNVVGDIRIEPGTGNTATVTGIKKAGHHGDPADVQIRKVESSKGLTVCVVYPGSHSDDAECGSTGNHRGRDWDQNDTKVDFTIRLPAGVSLDAATVSGDVIGRGVRGEVELASVSGDVRLDDVVAKLVEAHTVSGDVELTGVKADEVVAETVSGDVEFSGDIRPRGNYDMKTLSGDVTMRIPKNSGAQITGASFSGDFNTSFPITTTATSKYTSRKRINGTIGDGSARIRVESFSGDLNLKEIGAGK